MQRKHPHSISRPSQTPYSQSVCFRQKSPQPATEPRSSSMSPRIVQAATRQAPSLTIHPHQFGPYSRVAALCLTLVRQSRFTHIACILLCLAVYFIELGAFWLHARRCRDQFSSQAIDAPVQVSALSLVHELSFVRPSRPQSHRRPSSFPAESPNFRFAGIACFLQTADFDPGRPSNHHHKSASILPRSSGPPLLSSAPSLHRSLPIQSMEGSETARRQRQCCQGLDSHCLAWRSDRQGQTILSFRRVSCLR